jgi:DsbC/DsbD-like thiol-disulfide interchange protein
MGPSMNADRHIRASRRAVLAGLSASAGLLLSPPAARPAFANSNPRRADARASAWASGMHSRIRLVEAGLADADGLHVAVIEIGLDHGFKTYWRTPGDSGIPPVFAFDDSRNATDIKVHFPAPVRFEDGAGGHSIGYRGPTVELPVTFRAVKAGAPVTLAMKMDYAVCEKICVPATGSVELVVQPANALSQRAAKLMSEHVPRQLPLGAAGPLSVLRIARSAKAEQFRVEAALPGAGAADLFVEAASPWMFDAKPDGQAPGGRMVFSVLAIERDRAPDCRGVEITVTLVNENRAVETTTWLDVALLQP